MAQRSDGGGVGAWAVVLPDERYQAERLFQHDTLEFTGLVGGYRPAPGEPVLVLSGDGTPAVVALGRIGTGAGVTGTGPEPGTIVVSYTRRIFDQPVPADRLALDGPLTPVDPGTYQELLDQVPPAPDRRTWLVSLDLPIEASSPAEAVRIFWSYVRELGPRELPAFVSPAGNELAMQAFVLGVEANQDPEEDDEE